MTKDFSEINKKTNIEIQTLANLIFESTATERDRNRLAGLIYPKLHFFIKKFFNNDSEKTEEVLHNSVEKIFKNLHMYNNKWRFTTWIYNIAKNEALLYRHKLKDRKFVDIDETWNLTSTSDEFEPASIRETQLIELYNFTLQTIQEMESGLEKDILVDKELNLMKGSDISDKHEMNLNTVKTKLRKARKIIRDRVLREQPHFLETVKAISK